MSVWHHRLLLVFAVSQFPWRVIRSLMTALLCVNAANNSESACTHTHTYLRSCCIQGGTCRMWRHVGFRWMHACMRQLLLAVGCLHNQHSSTRWSQGKLSTVRREKRPPFHTWVVREWPTFTDGTDGKLKIAEFRVGLLFYSLELVYSAKDGFQLLLKKQTNVLDMLFSVKPNIINSDFSFSIFFCKATVLANAPICLLSIRWERLYGKYTDT